MSEDIRGDVVETVGWLPDHGPEQRALVRIRLAHVLDDQKTLPPGDVLVIQFASALNLGVVIVVPEGKTIAARKLRGIASFVRKQGRLDMDIQDELRALAALAKTLDSLPDPVAFRVLQWLNSRHHTRGPKLTAEVPCDLTTQESLGIARDRMGS